MPAIPLIPATVCPLDKTHDRSHFDCGNALLNRYLAQQARQDAQRYVAATFVLPDNQQRVRGFYTLSASRVALTALPAALAKKLPRYDYLPVTLLGRLAVDKTMQGKGAGQLLLSDALHRSLSSARQVGAIAVVVDAKDEQSASFYRHFDFLPFQQNPLRLFVPMQQIAQIIAP